jgi:Glyoxalase-like domain
MIRLRQAVVVASDLDAVTDELCAAFQLKVCYRDPGVETFGLCNALLAVGDTFLEVVSPIRDDTAAGRYLARRGGAGGYMVILQVDDLDRRRAHLLSSDVRIVWEGARPGVKGIHLHPADVGGAILSLDQAVPPDAWPWAGSDWRGAAPSDVAHAVVGVELQSESPEALAGRWSKILEAPATPGPDRTAAIDLSGGYLRFGAATDGRGEGPAAIHLACTDESRRGQETTIGGVRFRLVESPKGT